jgi:hypothetical protein
MEKSAKAVAKFLGCADLEIDKNVHRVHHWLACTSFDEDIDSLSP